MSGWVMGLALIATVLSGALFYAASPHSRRWHLRFVRGARTAATALALVGLGAWITAFGIAAGLCAMLGCWMLSLEAAPWLALLLGNPATHAEER